MNPKPDVLVIEGSRLVYASTKNLLAQKPQRVCELLLGKKKKKAYMRRLFVIALKCKCRGKLGRASPGKWTKAFHESHR